MLRAPPIAKPKGPASVPKPARTAARLVNRPAPLAASRQGGPRPAADMLAFPHRLEIGRLLGRAFKASAVLDRDGCARAGAPAFTTAGRAHFASPDPPLNVAAHEAAHVLQHRGETRDMGLGAEGHASAIEHSIAAGRKAGALLGSDGASTGAGLHYYTLVPKQDQSDGKWNAGADIRLSDDAKMAVEDQPRGSQNFWADIFKVIDSNAILEKLKSPLRLSVEGAKLIGPAPERPAQQTLYKMQILDLDNRVTGKDVWTNPDCGYTARMVMGATEGETVATYNKVLPVAAQNSPASEVRAGNPRDMEGEVLKGVFGVSSPAAGRGAYDLLSDSTRDWIDKKAGLNKYASVKTGEAYAITTGPKVRPGTVEKEGDFNFHWGTVVMTSGSDQVTLENYIDQQWSDWGFQMYGTAKLHQSFHEQHFESDKHGTKPVTMAVHKETGK